MSYGLPIYILEQRVSNNKGLLAEAKRKYPIGTIFLQPKNLGSERSKKEFTAKKEAEFYINNGISVCDSQGVIYYDGVWGEIIKK